MECFVFCLYAVDCFLLIKITYLLIKCKPKGKCHYQTCSESGNTAQTVTKTFKLFLNLDLASYKPDIHS